MGQCADRYEIDPALGIVAYRIDCNASRRFGFVTTGNELHGFTSKLGCKIIEHNTVDTPDPQYFTELVEITYFDLYFQILRGICGNG